MAAGQRLADLDAVTIDGYGTLLELDDPVGELQALLPGRTREDIEAAFHVEADYYVAHSHEGRDERTLALLQADCARVFGEALGSSVTTEQYMSALKFAVLPGVRDALTTLRARGLALAVVANWDFSLHEHLRRHGLHTYFDVVVTSAETGVKKPDATPFRLALERLQVTPDRALHVGDHEMDERGAAAAGLRFERAPLTDVLARWT